MTPLKISSVLKGFTRLENEPIENIFELVVRSVTVPLARPLEEIIGNCISRERQISGRMDTGLVLADLAPTLGFSRDLVLGLGVSERGIPWRWGPAPPQPASGETKIHFVLAILAPDDQSRLWAIRESARIFNPSHAPGGAILAAGNLEQAVARVRDFEESPEGL